MKLSRLGILFIVGLFVCSATIATSIYAQEFPPPGGKPGMAGGPAGVPGLHGLLPVLRQDLSRDQQKNLLDIFEKYHEMRMAYMDPLMALDREMSDIVAAETLDEENARAVFRKQATVREEMMILELKMNNEIKTVLSYEQRELLQPPGAGRPGRPFLPSGE